MAYTRFYLTILGVCCLMIGCDRKPKFDSREVYCLILKARVTAIRTIFDNTPESLTDRRHTATRCLQYVAHSPELSELGLKSLWQNVVILIDGRAAYLQRLSEISASLQDRKLADSQAANRAGWAGFLNEASKSRGSEDSTIVPSTIEGVNKWMAETQERNSSRAADNEALIKAAETEYLHGLDNFFGTSEFDAAAIAKKLNMQIESLGFDSLRDDVEFYRRQPMYSEEKSEKLKKWIMKRPTDPYLQSNLYVQLAHLYNLKRSESIQAAEQVDQMSKSLPDLDIFKADKAALLTDAADIIEVKLLRDHPLETAWSGAKEQQALIPIKYRRHAMQTSPDTNSPDMSTSISYDLFLAGNLKEAHEIMTQLQASESFEKTASSCLKFAELCSALGLFDEAQNWIRSLVVEERYVDIRHLRDDSDLAGLRIAKLNEFNALLEINWDWRIKYGIFNDDIIVTNNSHIWFTNVRVIPKLVQGSRIWNPELKVNRLGPGETHTWENVVSIPNDRLDSGTASLSCDQE